MAKQKRAAGLVDKNTTGPVARNRFEAGKCYEHPTGAQLHILATINSCMNGECFIAETGWVLEKRASGIGWQGGYQVGSYMPVSNLDGAAVDYIEISRETFLANNIAS